MFIGVVLVAIGALLLLDSLNLVEARDFLRTYWPVLLVVWGGSRVVFGSGGERVIGAGAMVFGGILMGNRLLGWHIRAGNLIWPAILLWIGGNILFRAYRAPAHDALRDDAVPGTPVTESGEAGATAEGVDPSSTIKEFAVMSRVERTNISQTFRGGEITAVMGGAEIDLRDCRMASNEVRVDVFLVMGGVEFRIPRDWTVESRVTLFMAGLEDKSVAPVDGSSSKRLILHGSAFMGGVEIKN